MTPDEIRADERADRDGSDRWLKEIAAQLAELNFVMKDVIAALDQIAAEVKPD